MRARDLIRFATRALTERKLRAALTILGIVIGPATIVALVGATQGYNNAATSRFSSLGATTLFVSPVGRGTHLTAADVPDIQNLQGVSYVLPYIQMNGQMVQGGQTISVQVIATDLAHVNRVLPNLVLAQGTVPTASDQVGADIGYSVANPDLQGATNLTVNEVLTLSNVGRGFGFGGVIASGSSTQRSFVIRGVYSQFGQSFVISPDNAAFVPLQTGEAILHTVYYSGLMVVASNANTVSQVETELTNEYGQTIRVTSVSSILSTVQSVTQGTQTLLEAVGGTSVMVAFIGIMTTMLTSVIERTREIGLLKALGSTSRGIMMVFLTEALVTGIIGGIIGVVAGAGLSYVIMPYLGGSSLTLGGGRGVFFGGGARPGAASTASSALTITPVISPETIGLALLLAVAVGAFGGLIPAWRASRLNPVEALKRS